MPQRGAGSPIELDGIRPVSIILALDKLIGYFRAGCEQVIQITLDWRERSAQPLGAEARLIRVWHMLHQVRRACALSGIIEAKSSHFGAIALRRRRASGVVVPTTLCTAGASSIAAMHAVAIGQYKRL